MNTKVLFAGALALATVAGATLALANGSHGGGDRWEPSPVSAEYLVDETFSKKSSIQGEVGLSLNFGAEHIVDDVLLKNENIQWTGQYLAFEPLNKFENKMDHVSGHLSDHLSHGGSHSHSGGMNFSLPEVDLPSKPDLDLPSFGHGSAGSM